MHPLTIRVMTEQGFDLAGHWAKGVREYLGKVFFRYLIIPCGKTEDGCPRVWPGVSERVFWPVENPTTYDGPEEEKLSKFREVRDQISELAKAWVEEKIAPRLPERTGVVPASASETMDPGALALVGRSQGEQGIW